MKPRVVQSLWTRPLEQQMYFVDRLAHLIGDMWLFTLSLCYLQREGFSVDLHTDSFGAALLGHLPYDNIHLTLDDVPAELSSRFWAAGKIWTLEAAGAGAVHVDGDIMIKRRALLEVPQGCQAIVQNTEYHHNFLWQREQIGAGWEQFCRQMGIDTTHETDYNTGILGIFDEELHREYLAMYKRMALEASERYGRELLEGTWRTPDLFCEQLQFYQLCQRRGAEVKEVLPGGDADAARLGYQHLITASKYTEQAQAKVRATLRKFFPEMYNQTYKKCRNI